MSAGPLLRFFFLTYAVAWTFFVAAASIPDDDASITPALSGLREFLFLVGTFAPAFVALWLTSRSDGHTGVGALLRRVLESRVRARWYLFAVGYMVAIKLTVALVYRIAAGEWPRFGDEAWYIVAAAVLISTPAQAGEELGWRGYALPRLAARFGLARGSLLLGVLWACWHLPLFFIPGVDKYGQSLLLYILGGTALSVAMAWLYGHAHGSLLLAMLMHSAVNQTKDIVPSNAAGATNPFSLNASLVGWITLALLWICAGYFLARMPSPEFNDA